MPPVNPDFERSADAPDFKVKPRIFCESQQVLALLFYLLDVAFYYLPKSNRIFFGANAPIES